MRRLHNYGVPTTKQVLTAEVAIRKRAKGHQRLRRIPGVEEYVSRYERVPAGPWFLNLRGVRPRYRISDAKIEHIELQAIWFEHRRHANQPRGRAGVPGRADEPCGA